MKGIVIWFSFFLTLSAGENLRQQALRQMVEAERSFARMAREKGSREAFLTYLAADAFLLRPGPVKARPIYEKAPAGTQSLLSWEPEFADMATSVDLGYDTGPYRFFADRGQAEPNRYGHFVTIWKKSAKGEWRVLADTGNVHAKPDRPSEKVESPAEGAPKAKEKANDSGTSVKAVEDLRLLVATFWLQVKTKGFIPSLIELAGDDLRFYPEQGFPLVGLPAIRSALANEVFPIEGELGEAGASLAGDLGYVCGSSRLFKTTTSGQAETTAVGGYLMICKRDCQGVFRIVLFTTIHHPVSS